MVFMNSPRTRAAPKTERRSVGMGGRPPSSLALSVGGVPGGGCAPGAAEAPPATASLTTSFSPAGNRTATTEFRGWMLRTVSARRRM